MKDLGSMRVRSHDQAPLPVWFAERYLSCSRIAVSAANDNDNELGPSLRRGLGLIRWMTEHETRTLAPSSVEYINTRQRRE